MSDLQATASLIIDIYFKPLPPDERAALMACLQAQYQNFQQPPLKVDNGAALFGEGCF